MPANTRQGRKNQAAANATARKQPPANTAERSGSLKQAPKMTTVTEYDDDIEEMNPEFSSASQNRPPEAQTTNPDDKHKIRFELFHSSIKDEHSPYFEIPLSTIIDQANPDHFSPYWRAKVVLPALYQELCEFCMVCDIPLSALEVLHHLCTENPRRAFQVTVRRSSSQQSTSKELMTQMRRGATNDTGVRVSPKVFVRFEFEALRCFTAMLQLAGATLRDPSREPIERIKTTAFVLSPETMDEFYLPRGEQNDDAPSASTQDAFQIEESSSDDENQEKALQESYEHNSFLAAAEDDTVAYQSTRDSMDRIDNMYQHGVDVLSDNLADPVMQDANTANSVAQSVLTAPSIADIATIAGDNATQTCIDQMKAMRSKAEDLSEDDFRQRMSTLLRQEIYDIMEKHQGSSMQEPVNRSHPSVHTMPADLRPSPASFDNRTDTTERRNETTPVANANVTGLIDRRFRMDASFRSGNTVGGTQQQFPHVNPMGSARSPFHPNGNRPAPPGVVHRDHTTEQQNPGISDPYQNKFVDPQLQYLMQQQNQHRQDVLNQGQQQQIVNKQQFAQQPPQLWSQASQQGNVPLPTAPQLQPASSQQQHAQQQTTKQSRYLAHAHAIRQAAIPPVQQNRWNISQHQHPLNGGGSTQNMAPAQQNGWHSNLQNQHPHNGGGLMQNTVPGNNPVGNNIGNQQPTGNQYGQYYPAGPTGRGSIPPSWNSPQRQGFPYPGRNPGEIDGRRRDRGPIIGDQWYAFHTHTQVHSDMDPELINPTTGLIWDWIAIRQHYGYTSNHPVNIPMQHLDKEVFLSFFQGATFHTKNQRNFMQSFPIYDGGNDLSQLLAYCSGICTYCSSHYVYVPPVHTYVPDNVLGVWFDSLPLEVRRLCSTTYSGLIYQGLMQKSTGFIDNPIIRQTLQNFTMNGYRALYQLVQLGGQPSLNHMPSSPSFPRQLETETVDKYSRRWLHCLHVNTLNGTHYSDRFFLIKFYENLHASMKFLRDYLHEMHIHFSMGQFLNEPLPFLFSPGNIVSTLLQHVSPSVGSAPGSADYSHLMTKTPREIINGAAGVSAISSFATNTSSHPFDGPLSTDELHELKCRSIERGASKSCYFCNKPGHLIYECELAQELKKNPRGIRCVRAFLADDNYRTSNDNTRSTSTLNPKRAPPVLKKNSKYANQVRFQQHTESRIEEEHPPGVAETKTDNDSESIAPDDSTAASADKGEGQTNERGATFGGATDTCDAPSPPAAESDVSSFNNDVTFVDLSQITFDVTMDLFSEHAGAGAISDVNALRSSSQPTMSSIPVESVCADDIDSTNVPDLNKNPAALYMSDLYATQTLVNETTQTLSDFYNDFAQRFPELLHNKTNSTPTKSSTRAHIDGGSMINITNRKDLLFALKDLTPTQRPSFRVADNTEHHATQVGYLKVPSPCALGYTFERTYYTPSVPATILSPDVMAKAHGCSGYTAVSMFEDSCSLRLHNCKRRSQDVFLRLHRHGGLLFSDELMVPTKEERMNPLPKTSIHECQLLSHVATECDGGCQHEETTEQFCSLINSGSAPPMPPTKCSECTAAPYVHAMTRDQLRLLWHQRLGHVHSRRASTLHKSVIGVPNLPIASEIDGCPVCNKAKIRKANRSTEDSKQATECNQGISIDFGFIVQGNHDSERVSTSTGLNGETCYVLITDHKGGTLYGETCRSKAPPLDFVNRWLIKHGRPASCKNKYVRMDLGGELGRCPEIHDKFEQAGYDVQTTAAMSSSSNGPGERPHQTICNGIRAMLDGAGLPPKFWPYAFHHFLRLYNFMPHGERDASPYEICSGKKPDLSHIKTFGCRCFAMPARPRRASRLVSDSCTGIFLGYSKSLRNALYFDIESQQVKTTQHIRFDELFNGEEDKPPNARLLAGVAPEDVYDSLNTLDVDKAALDLDVVTSPFDSTVEFQVPVHYNSDESPLGFTFQKCSTMLRAYVSAIDRAPTKAKLRTIRRHHIGSYVVSIDGNPIFSLDDIENVMQRLRSLNEPPVSIPIVLAPMRSSTMDTRSSPLHLRLNDVRRIAALMTTTRDSNMSSRDYDKAVTDSVANISDGHLQRVVHQVQTVNRLQTDGMTDEEKALKSFTRRNLQRLSNWTQWDDAFDAQLDNHQEAGAIGMAVERPRGTPGETHNVLRVHWNNLVKPNGKRKCRSCIDGSKRAAPWLREFAKTYASCIDTPCMRLFFALSASLGFKVVGADTTNAYQQSPGPSVPCFLEVDDAIASWYLKRYGVEIDRKRQVIPLNKAFQGHPEAGALWEGMISGILEDELGFNSTTQEKNLYVGRINGSLVLVCRQVDDFAIASRSQATAEELVKMINARATTVSEGIGVTSSSGIVLRYNGLDVHQTRDYIKINCENYITRVLQTHGWDSPQFRETDRHDLVPMSAREHDTLSNLEQGPLETTREHHAIEKKAGFSYRQLLGELTYAYVICRPDIGYAVTFLSRFSTAPTAAHYRALKSICKYLRSTRNWGIVYWRTKPVSDFPHIPHEIPSWDDNLPLFPLHPLTELVGYVDAAHATDMKSRRSVTGLLFTFAGGAVAYKSKLQATVATSSTEAEFIAAVHAAKIAKYLRSVLNDLGFPPDGPTKLYEDNKAAIAMINESRPTERSRHIDIQHFAIQEWRAKEQIEMVHISTTIHPADQSTKCLGWILHSRHARRAMGHYGGVSS